MKYSILMYITLMLLSLFAPLRAGAVKDHKDFIKGQLKDGRDVTRQCLACHDKQASDFIKTAHWTWKGTPNHVQGRENTAGLQGKANISGRWRERACARIL